MRSLALKLTAAFLFVSVIGIFLVGFIVRQQTQAQFNQFVLDRFQLSVVENLTSYYKDNGSWDGIDRFVMRTPFPRADRAGVQGQPLRNQLILADSDGIILIGRGRQSPGVKLVSNDQKTAIPIEVDGETAGYVFFANFDPRRELGPESPEIRFLENINRAIFIGAAGAIAIALILAAVLARTISRPVRELTTATKLVAKGELGTAVPVRTKDELGELATSFNLMSADLARATENRRQMTADVAHDLRTPLSVILGYTESLSDGKIEPSQEVFDTMHAKAHHLQRLVDDLRVLALADAGELPLMKRPVQPRLLLEHAALDHMVAAQDRNIVLEVNTTDDLPEIEVDPDRMAQVLGNLVTNALRHTADDGRITLSATAKDTSILLTVADSGSGIHPDDLPHIFDRFYRGDRSRHQNGSAGLGLAIAQSIVLAHGGEITVDSELDRGTTFTIDLPI